MSDHPPPHGIDVTTPSAARLYDYYLGGKDNYAADRQAAQQLFERVPELKTMAQANREFLARVVDYLAGQAGIRQFIDLGSGLPSANNTHQVAQRHAPSARVVYVDYDPMVNVHAQALLDHNPANTAFIHGDLRDPATVLAHPDLVERIDFAQPVAVLMVAVLHFVRDVEEPHHLVQEYRSHLCPGSAIALSHVERDTHPERADHLEAIYASTSTPGQTRSIAQITGVFDSMELVEPGLVHVADWRRPFRAPYYPADQAWVVGGVGCLPSPQGTVS